METFIELFSNIKGEILRFINDFNKNLTNNNNNNSYNINISEINFTDLKWKQKYNNPIDMADMIGLFIENNNKYKINMWVCLDKDILINVTQNNADEIIRYLYERYPY